MSVCARRKLISSPARPSRARGRRAALMSTTSLYLDFTTAALPCRWRCPRNDGRRYFLICGETSTYRSLARTLTLPDDDVLELGCSFGDATTELASRAQSVRAVDNSAECITRTSARLQQMRDMMAFSGAVDVHQLDVFGNTAQLLTLGAGIHCCYVDLGGARAMSGPYVTLLLNIQAALKPQLMVIKSRELHEQALQALGDTSGGVLPPERQEAFWSACWARAAAPTASEPRSQPPSGMEEVDAHRVPADERRICYSYLNKGRCKKAACAFRHLPPTHPEAIADQSRRAQVGWRPERVRGLPN